MSDELKPNDDRDELHDRLIDRSLREMLGGEAPPDLSERILAAAGLPVVAVAVPVGGDVMSSSAPDRNAHHFPWGLLAIAASLMVGAAWLLLPPIQASREAARRAPATSNLKQIGDARGPANGPVASEGADDGLQMMVKPHVIVQSDRSQYYSEGAPVPATTVLTDGAAVVPSNGLGLQGVVGDAYQATETQAQGRRVEGLAAQAAVTGVAPAPTATELSGLTKSRSRWYATPTLGTPVTPVADGQGAQGETGAAESWGLVGMDGGSGAVAAPGQRIASVESLALESRTSRVSPATAPPASATLGIESETASLDVYNRYGGGGGKLVADEVADADSDHWEQLSLKRLHEWALENGRGPDLSGDQYARIIENPFQAINAATTDNRLSTFSIDVDTASYANVRQFLMDSGTLPPPDAVRIEELVNYFDYDYSAPTGDVPFAANVEVAACPWAPEHRLARIGIKGREMERQARPKSNLVFLVDVSGSMDEPNKLPLLVEGMRMLTRELGENDRVAIVVYASTEGLALESTRGDKQQVILEALDRLQAGGSTAGGAGIVLAYKMAEENFIEGGVNRVILCTDGDFNVGVTSPAELQRMAEEKAKNTGVFLTVLGFGRGNLNDAMMEAVADHGNGNYHYVDNRREARKVLVEEMTGTLVTIAKDVKIQVEFNPAQVAGYRLIGYENRVLAAEDFNDDKKDAGEIGAGHTVTALYEIVPVGKKVDAAAVDELKYKAPASVDVADVERVPDRDGLEPAASNEMLTLKIRYKQPDGDESTKLEFPITDNGQAFAAATDDFQFAAAVASFGMILRQSQFKGDATLAGVAEIAESASRDRDPHGYRKEFVEMVKRVRELAGQ